jgi:anaerobic magnesium-protoporphyrin IX monomethyl ester cyclase
MKILLIYPYCLEDRLQAEDISVVPQGVYFIAALLKKHSYDVKILNWHAINKTPHQIKAILLETQPDLIGFSILHANRWGGIEIARIAKQIDPDVKIVFGGIGATFLWEHFLVHFPEIDYVVIGEGEYTFLNLVNCLKDGKLNEIEHIKGLAFRRFGRAVRNEDADAICDLDQLPIPAQYFSYQHVSLTRGCGGNCKFCGSPEFWGRKIRFHSPDYFVAQLELLYARGVRFIYVSDDTFTVNRKTVIEICQKIIQKKMEINWAAISRIDMIDEDVLYWMRKAGCIQISYGVESGSKNIRKFLKKKISDAQICRAFKLTQQYGIMARAYFIYGCPQESWQTIQETIDLIDRIKPLSAIFYILDIFPGTALYQEYKANFKLSDDIWLNRIEDIMYFETDPVLSRDLILAFGHKLRTCFYDKLPEFVEALDLVDRKDLYRQHADFFSRLALTFDKGDYANIDAIANKKKIAERLYRRSLEYGPHARAYLGLGIICQKKGAFEESIRILSEGIEMFPDDEHLHICLAISYMNMGKFKLALSHLLKFEHRKESLHAIATCYRALNDIEKAQVYFKRLETLNRQPLDS